MNEKVDIDDLSATVGDLIQENLNFGGNSNLKNEISNFEAKLEKEKKIILGQIEKFKLQNPQSNNSERKTEKTVIREYQVDQTQLKPLELTIKKLQEKVQDLEMSSEEALQKDIIINEDYQMINERLNTLEEGLDYI